MPFDHNDHYHRLLLRQVPAGCGTALDVGCGTGRFARRLARRGIAVHAVDPSAEVIAAARRADAATETAGAPLPRFEHADITELELPARHYDFISCLASIHHMPFDTVATLRTALAPGGVLVILGCHPEHSLIDLAAAPANAVARLAVGTADLLRPSVRRGPGRVRPPIAPPTMRLADIRREAGALLPGCRIRRLLFWRYLLVFRESDAPPAD